MSPARDVHAPPRSHRAQAATPGSRGPHASVSAPRLGVGSRTWKATAPRRRRRRSSASHPAGLPFTAPVERLLRTAAPAGADPAATGPVDIRATKSQVAFRGSRRGFAYVWWPGRYVRSGVPAVLSIALRSRINSPRFKSVVNPSPGLWMHHLELRTEEDLDAEVAGWLKQARNEAG